MPRFNMNWIYLIVIAALAIFYFTGEANGVQQPRSAQKEATYNEFKARVDSGYATRVVVNKDTKALNEMEEENKLRERVVGELYVPELSLRYYVRDFKSLKAFVTTLNRYQTEL